MTKFKSFFLRNISVVVILLFSSCATILNGPTTHVKLNYNDSIKVTLNGMELSPGAREVNIKSKSKSTVSMLRTGYKPLTQEMYQVNSDKYLLNLITSLAASLVYIFATASKSPGSYNPILGLGIELGGFGALELTDIISGSNKKLYPDYIEWKPVKLPQMITAKEQFPIGCSNVNIRMKVGEKIGSVMFKQKEKTEVLWENTVNIKSEELEVIVNNLLKDYGFKVPKEVADKGYSLNAEVSGINITDNVVSALPVLDLIDCKLTVRWTLTDLSTNEVVKTQTVESSNLEKGKSINIAFYSAFENSILIFLSANPEVNNLVTMKEEMVVHSDFEMISIPKPKYSNKPDLQEFTQSVVTIESGDEGHGSGFFISNDGYIITNYHVVKENKKVNVILNGGLSFIGDVIRFDKAEDIALVKISGKGFKSMFLSESDSNDRIGTEVYAIGTPTDKGLSQTVTKGIISGNRLINNVSYIQSDVSVSPGNSGGPLISKSGLILGIISSKIIGRGVEGISFAIPASKVFEFLKLKYGN